MKTIGLLGGMSWESTVGYYRAINAGVKKTLGGFHSAKIVLYSVDFAQIEKLQRDGDWEGTAAVLCEAALSIQAAGAEFLLLCTNTMHKVAPEIEKAITISLLHIADATGEALVRNGIQTAGLLGTAFTMEHNFYKGRLRERYGLDVLVPDEADRRLVHQVIFQELCLGKIEPDSRTQFLHIINRLAEQGAEAVILGCTEIGMLVSQEDTPVKLFDTTEIHAAKAVEQSLFDPQK
ncbi:aspartate/glutamate racemase family protein [Desulfococcus sp.]|uniref:aspartate/glutamate racemase family protein n=1 Tax=Desulfococcus sp. TaxID=2025834 RepID=UPI0035941205